MKLSQRMDQLAPYLFVAPYIVSYGRDTIIWLCSVR